MLQPLLPYTPERDVYRLLGVPANASVDEITAACRQLARTFHPDRNRSNRATAEMQVVNVVRKVLSDPEMRAVYDRERMRFHTVSARALEARFGGPLRVDVQPDGLGPVGRYVRAAAAGLRAAVTALLPARCGSCRIVIAGEDAYCAACGTPLLTGG